MLALDPQPRIRWMKEAADTGDRLMACLGELGRYCDPDHLDKAKGVASDVALWDTTGGCKTKSILYMPIGR